MKTNQYHIPDIALRVVLDGPAVIYVCKAYGDYAPMFITSNVERQLGYTDEEFLSKPDFWIERIHPDDKGRVLEDLEVLFETGHYKHEYRFLHKDGSYRWMYDELTLIKDHTGASVEIVGYWVDISERIKVQEKYNQLEVKSEIMPPASEQSVEAVITSDGVMTDEINCIQCAMRDSVLCRNLTANCFKQAPLPITDLAIKESQTIYYEGETGHSIYKIRTGLVKLEVMMPDGNRRVVRLLNKGDIIGLETLVGQPYRHTVTALNHSDVCQIPTTLIHNLRTHSAALSYDLMVSWDRENSLAYEWLAKLNTGPARQRVIRLIDFLTNKSESTPEFALPSRNDMSSLLGLTRETVSRVVSDLKREGVITFYGDNTYERHISM